MIDILKKMTTRGTGNRYLDELRPVLYKESHEIPSPELEPSLDEYKVSLTVCATFRISEHATEDQFNTMEKTAVARTVHALYGEISQGLQRIIFAAQNGARDEVLQEAYRLEKAIKI